MPATEENFPTRWQWLDWWFAPRWRALLTWVVLTAIGAAVFYAYPDEYGYVAKQPIVILDHFLPAPLPPGFYALALHSNFLLLLVWFQPLALRLNLWRGLTWISLTLVAISLFHILGTRNLWTWNIIYGASSALRCGVLWGWRKRSWMCLPAWAAAEALWLTPLLRLRLPFCLGWAVSALPTAALLLYGTRLLAPEERQACSAGRVARFRGIL